MYCRSEWYKKSWLPKYQNTLLGKPIGYRLIYDNIAETTVPLTGDFTARVAQCFARQAHSVNIVLSAWIIGYYPTATVGLNNIWLTYRDYIQYLKQKDVTARVAKDFARQANYASPRNSFTTVVKIPQFYKKYLCSTETIVPIPGKGFTAEEAKHFARQATLHYRSEYTLTLLRL